MQYNLLFKPYKKLPFEIKIQLMINHYDQRWSAIMNLLDVLDPLKLIYLMNQDLM
jgi:hypothetical protein